MKEDRRVFAWVKVLGWAGYNPIYPVIIHGDGIGSKLEFVSDLHLMQPHEYTMSLTELAARYPAPEVKPEP